MKCPRSSYGKTGLSRTKEPRNQQLFRGTETVQLFWKCGLPFKVISACTRWWKVVASLRRIDCVLIATSMPGSELRQSYVATQVASAGFRRETVVSADARPAPLSHA